MKFLQKTVPIIFILMFSYIIVLLVFFSSMKYVGKETFMLPNIIIIPIFVLVLFGLVKLPKKKDITRKKYYKYIIIISIVIYLIQLLIQLYGAFKTGWDAGYVNFLSDCFIENNNKLCETAYLTRYPNNIMITFILIVLKKITYPILGKRLILVLAVNALLVNLSGVFASLVVDNITKNRRLALSTYYLSIPLILLSPWIFVAYTDTFAIIFPILIVYLYTKKDRNKLDFFLIVFLSIFGYFIKATVAIVLIAIFIIEIFNFNKAKLKKIGYKQLAIYSMLFVFGIITPFLIKNCALRIMHFEKDNSVPEFTLVHYLALGQNNETNGAFSGDDMYYSLNNGMGNNYNRFKERLFGRTPKEQVVFFSKKTLLNFNNGAFAYGREGSFYSEVRITSDKKVIFVRNLFYKQGKYYKYILQIQQYLWLLVILFIPFIVKKKNTKEELLLMTAIIGITLFLAIFEARSRYLYCYAPLFVASAVMGISNLKKRLIKTID